MSYNLTTMQSIYHNQDEIVEITYNNSPVYQKSGPTPTYDIRYTTTNNQQLTLYNTSGVQSHTFNNNTGYITLDSNKNVPDRMFNNCTTLHKIYYSAGVTFSGTGYQHAGCTSLDYVELPSDLTTIVQRLFRECTSLMAVTIPASVTFIGAYPWWHAGLGNHNAGKYQPDVTFQSTTPPVANGSSGYPERSFITDESATQVTAYNTIYKLVPYESYPNYCTASTWITSNNYIDWFDDDTTDYALLPFFIENTTDNAETITIRNRDNVTSDSDMSGTMSISDDGTTWTELCTLPQSNFTFPLPAHTRKYLKATCTSFSRYERGNAIYGMDTIGGNINTLMNGSASKVDVTGNFVSAFATGSRDDGNDVLINAKNLCTDYTTGSTGRMFSGCHYLTHAPKIIGGRACIAKVFLSCNRLTHAPKILDSTLVEDQFYHAFEHDNHLTAVNIGEITYAQTNDPDDFDRAFYSCSSLSYIKCMFDPSTLHNNFSQFTEGVAASGVFVKKVGVTWPTGNTGIPSGWTVLEATE